MDKIKRFSRIFNGLERAHGIYKEDPNLRKDSGKVGGRAQTVEGELTEEKWQAHLDGKVGVGVVPILDDGTCWFSAIDFDNYNEFTVKRFVMDAKRSGFPFVWCKSKSGGAHLYTFFSEPANAAKVRAKLSDLARTLGYPKIEIFPKQEQLDVAKGEVGNWINLPYFHAEFTQRYAFDDSAQPIAEFEKFLDYAESKRIDPADFDKLKVEAQEIPFSDGPPCIQAMAHNGVGEGERNKALFQFALYAKKKHPDDWQEHVLEWNNDYFSPQLKFKEIQATVFKSLESDRDYGYLCKEPVCSELCNKPLCQTREFGVMGGLVQVWEDWNIEGVRKIVQVNAVGAVMDAPPQYTIAINGQDITFSRPELTSNLKFREKVFERLDKMPPRMNNAMWDQMIQHWLINHEVIEIPYELTATASLGTLLKDFIDGSPEAKARSDLLRGHIMIENGQYLFHFESFSRYLQQQRYPNTSPGLLWQQLKNLGVEKKTTTTAGNKKLNYWMVSEEFMHDGESSAKPYSETIEF